MLIDNFFEYLPLVFDLSKIELSDVISLILSLIAIIISIVALYYSHLRNAKIILSNTNLTNRTDVKVPGWSSIWPTQGIILYYKVYLENLGGRIGAFEGINVTVTPNIYEFIELDVSTELYLGNKEEGTYKKLPERIPIKDSDVIPAMLKITYKYKTSQTCDNFKKLWDELITLYKKEQPNIVITYTVKEGTKALSSKSKEPLKISNLAKDILGAYKGTLSYEATRSNLEFGSVAAKALKDLEGLGI